MKATLSIAAVALVLMGMPSACSKKNIENTSGNHAVDSSMPAPAPVTIVGGETGGNVNQRPKATAFKMNGDYYDKVAVTLGDNGEFIYFPDPADIRESSKPVDLGNGWWLNRQGIGPNSIFTEYTFDEYSKLPSVPSKKELKEKIIPGSGVTEFMTLPIPADKAMENLDRIKGLLTNPQ